MAKAKTHYVCQNCGNSQTRWMGRCPDCGEWNSLAEFVERPQDNGGRLKSAMQTLRSTPQPITEIPIEKLKRLEIPLQEFNRVLGGGLVPGSLVLIGGDPGIGKSTLLLQAVAMLAQHGLPVLYVSGEESAQQIKLRAERLGLSSPNLYLFSENSMNVILDHIQDLRPHAVVIDSIQAVSLEELTSLAGSVTQVRECTARLMSLAKTSEIPIFIVGHVTKSGAIAGPRVLEHMVDAVLYLEGERFHAYRLLRGVKNRFGSTNEVGVFEMAAGGMVEIANPSEAFLAERMTHSPGSAIAVTIEGTRPILVEIQALTSPTNATFPRRTANGIDPNRLLLLVAVLTKRVGLRLTPQDVFVNVVGGLRIAEPAADLAVAVAIASSYRNLPVAPDLAIMGEIGLSGELRTVSHAEKRLREAAKLGFKRCLVPKSLMRARLEIEGLELLPARSLFDALDTALIPRTQPTAGTLPPQPTPAP
ncbi:MAG: DNA repair protein RadA [Chloroflexi bacterium]|nr:DNA repair protein RadA [Chloroflexota bacterium]